MIRWTEKADCLRVDYGHTGVALGLVVCGAATLLLGVVCLFTTLSSIMDPRQRVGAVCPFVSMAVLGFFSRFCFVHAARLREWKGWAEVAIRGGQARWGECGSEPTAPMIPVRRFEIEERAIGRPGLVALLPDGARRAVLGPWVEGERDMICRLARELNRYLGEPVDSITAG